MSDDGTVRKVLLGKADERRKTGSPKFTLLDCIGNDLKSMSVKIMWKKAEDRSACAIILKEALFKI
jgi:hypothetical protein